MIFVRTASALEDFYKIDAFLNNSKKAWILDTSSEAEAEKNKEKIVLRNMRFSDIDFLVFFCDFYRFCLDFRAPRALKKLKKIKKTQKK